MLENIITWLKHYPFIYENLIFLLVILLAYFSYLFTKVILFKVIHRLVEKTKTDLDDIMLNEKLLRKLAQIPPLLVIHQFLYLLPSVQDIFTRIIEAVILFFVLQCFAITLNSANSFYEKSEKHKSRPIKGYLQIVAIIIYIMGAIFFIGLLTGQSPWSILGGIGALTAVLLLVFKDTILSFVASIQITSYDLVKVDDWIEVPSLGVDGDVMDIALHTIKVRNFDKTITVIPTHKLIEVPFKNWRGMQQTGGRRIKRSIHLDLSSVKFCDSEMLTKFKKINLLKEYLSYKESEINDYNSLSEINSNELVNGRRLTNLGTFREYIKAYLKNRKDIRSDLTFLIRQLPPGPNGLPIEIYVFANTIAWVEYEEIQADIFDHLLAVVPEFELKMFQTPTGYDIRELKS
ncbi:MAG: mechanosensitive ion channel family protein [Bacteroidetes bacterium]|nr:mechanosensitive ion channel family protein [Bacteroidota bacterium]